jgi:hypothetical protein
MNPSVPSVRAVLALVSFVLLASSAQARDTVLHLPVAAALSDPSTRPIVGATPLRFGAASSVNADLLQRDVQIDGSAEPLRENANQRDSKPPSDESVCQLAFADAMKRLVASAHQAGAAAVVGIVWSFKGQLHDDATAYECHAGSFHSYVSLRAQLARTLPHTLPVPAKSGYAELADLDAVPSTPAGKARYAHFLTLPRPRAFAFAEDGTWRFWADDPDAMTKVFDDCARQGKRCWLYAVDDNVVWNADEARRIAGVAQLRGAASAVSPKDEHQ